MEQASKTAAVSDRSVRDRFVEGLPRRARELIACISAVSAEPGGSAALADLQRKLQALLVSASSLEDDELAQRLTTLVARLTTLASDNAPLTANDYDALAGLLSQLAMLAGPTALPQAGSGVRAQLSEVQRSQTRAERWVPAEEPPHDAPALLSQTLSGQVAVPSLSRVLLVCSRAHAVVLHELLQSAPLQLLHAVDAEQAIESLHTAAPTHALLSAEFATLPDLDLVRRLQTDPASQLEAVYLVLPEGASYDAEYLRQTGADGVLVEPLSAAELGLMLSQAPTRRSGRGRLRAQRLGRSELRAQSDGTVEEIASYVAEEVRSGIADALRSGVHERVRLDDTRELLAAAWTAVSRVRTHLAHQSRGRIRFRDDALQEPDTGVTSLPSEAPLDLRGMRVLIADDDPAVLWFFSGLLREASAQVLQAHDGREALELARRKQPHLVLSDILMPHIDGLALCHELARDALLAHVPLILLSWKEDLLERMRELGAGASGYLRKEAGSAEALAVVRRALAPRERLRAMLQDDAEACGKLAGLGILSVLETVAALRPNARVSVEDAWNLFELELRDGREVSVTRTAADGSYTRGERALLQLLGVNAGRFRVVTQAGKLRSALAEPFAIALQTAGESLSAVLAAVSDARLLHVSLLTFEDDVVDCLLRCTPTRLHEVVARFRRVGATARELLLDGSFTPVELEQHLRELARRGAISGVWNADGEDLLERARRDRAEQPGSLLHAAQPGAGSAWFSGLSGRGSPLPLPAATLVLQPMAAEPAILDGMVDALPMLADVPAANEQTATGTALARLPRATRETAAGLRLVLTLAALVLIGYLGWRRLEPETRLALPTARLETSLASGTDPERAIGRSLPYVDSAYGVQVAADQGLLVIESAGESLAPELSIDGRALGRPPIAIALSADRHELAFDRRRVRLIVRTGETRIVTLPLD